MISVLLTHWCSRSGTPTWQGDRIRGRARKTKARADAQSDAADGHLVAKVDKELFENMSAEQLELVADQAWRRRRRMETDEPGDEEMQRRDVLLRLRTLDPEATRIAVEGLFDDFLKKWRLGGVVHEKDGSHVVEYAVQLKKEAHSSDLIAALNAKSQVIGVEIK